MISAEYCRLMARYNQWQNASLIAAADTLSDAARWQARGAFFGSIAATFNHLYWADALILARLAGEARPHERIHHSLTEPQGWAAFKRRRAARDAQIIGWAQAQTPETLTGQVTWEAPDGSGRETQSKALCAVQLFNHQTHHRGQIHAMLTAAGASPGVTDLTAMPGAD